MNIIQYLDDIKQLGVEIDTYNSQPWNVIELIISNNYKSDFLNYMFDCIREENYDINIILCKERIVKEELYRISAKKINFILQNLPKKITAIERQQLLSCAVSQNGYVLFYLSKYYRKKYYNAGYIQLKNALKIVPEEIIKLNEAGYVY